MLAADDGAAEADAGSPALSLTSSAPTKGCRGRKPKGWEEAAASYLLREDMGQRPEPDTDQPVATAEALAAGDGTTAAARAEGANSRWPP